MKNTLTAEEAAEYTIKNVCGGSDNWQPDLMCEACDAPIVKGEGSRLSWQAVPYAICYVITKNGEVAGFTQETSFDGYTVQPMAPLASATSPPLSTISPPYSTPLTDVVLTAVTVVY